jgi:hypothetical protein
MKLIGMLTLTLGIAVLAAGSARANDPAKHQCSQDARVTRNSCVRVCQDDFLASMDTCHGVNHDCAQTARDNREACVSGVLQALKQCVVDTCGELKAAIDQCRIDFAKGTPERDACIDAAQVKNFQCRDGCRESVQLFPSLKACRDEFKTDLQACAVPPPAGK